MPLDAPDSPLVTLTDREQAVLKEAIRQYLDDPRFATELDEETVEEILNTHLQSALEDGTIRVEPGMTSLYQAVFKSYASALKEEVQDEDGSEAMADFFEGAFKSIIDKLEDQSQQGHML